MDVTSFQFNMIKIGLLLLALQLMDSEGTPHNNIEVIFGSSFRQYTTVFDSQFVHFKLPLRIDSELQLAENLLNFFKSQGEDSVALNNAQLTYWLQRLRLAFQVPSVDRNHPLRKIEHQILPYLESSRRQPLTSVYQTTPSSLDTSEEQLQSDNESLGELYDVLGLGNVPGGAEGQSESTSSHSTTGVPREVSTTVPSAASDPPLRRLSDRLSQRIAESSSPEQQDSSGPASQASISTTDRTALLGQQAVGERSLERDLSASLRLLLQNNTQSQNTIGRTALRKRLENAFSTSGGSRTVSQIAKTGNSSGLAGAGRVLGNLLRKTRRNQIPVSLRESPPTLPNFQSRFFPSRFKRFVQAPVLYPSGGPSVLAEDLSTGRQDGSQHSFVQHAMAKRDESKPFTCCSCDPMGHGCVCLSIFSCDTQDMPTFGKKRKLCQMCSKGRHPSRLREVLQHNQDNESSSPALRKSCRELCNLELGTLYGQSRHHDLGYSFTGSLSQGKRIHEEENSTHIGCFHQHSKNLSAVHPTFGNSTRAARNCEFTCYSCQFTSSDLCRQSILKLCIPDEDTEANDRAFFPVTYSQRARRLKRNDLSADSTGFTPNVWGSGHRILFGTLRSNLVTTLSGARRVDATQNSPGSGGGLLLKTQAKKDPLKLTTTLRRLLIKLAQEAIRKHHLSPKLSLSKCLLEASSEIFITQAMTRLLTGLEKISEGKFMQFVPRTFLEQMTQQIKGKLDMLPAGHTYRTVNLTGLDAMELQKLPVNIYRNVHEIYAVLSIPITKNQYTALFYDKNSSQIKRDSQLYSLKFAPKNSLILHATNSTDLKTIPSKNYLQRNCVSLKNNFYCLKPYLDAHKDKCLMKLYNDEPSLAFCNGRVDKQVNIAPVEIEPNKYAVLSTRPVQILHICNPPMIDKMYVASGAFDVHLTKTCPKLYLDYKVMHYKTPTVACVDPNLKCRDFAENLFTAKNVARFLNHVQSSNGPAYLNDLHSNDILNYPNEILIPATISVAVFALLFCLLCIRRKLAGHRHSTVRRENIPLNTLALLDNKNTVYRT